MKNASPVGPADRSDILDILRGFALLGICIANSAYFSMYIFKDKAARAAMPFPEADQWLTHFHVAFVDGKFYSIFSLLFGIGFSIIFYGRQGQGNRLALFYKRLGILFLIGLIHGLLIWDGDILMFYALSGLLLPLFRNVKPATLFVIAGILIVSPLLFDWIKVLTNNTWNMSNQFLKLALAEDKRAGITEKNLQTWVVVNNSYQDLLAWNRSGFWWSWQMRIDGNRIQKIIAMFLIGLAAGKTRLYSRIGELRQQLLFIMELAFAIGITTGLAKAYFETDEKALPKPGGLWDTLAYTLNVAPLAIAYCLWIALAHERKKHLIIFDWLKPVGRMALTNYILQSVICLSIYYGFGLGIASRVGPSFFVPMAFVIFIGQIILSRIWLRHFNFGPLEWIWRQLTYGKRLPLRKEAL